MSITPDLPWLDLAMREIVLDTETTGLDPYQGHRLIEVGCIELLNRIPSGQTFHHYINPDRDVNGVGLIYFANYVSFMDLAERATLEEFGGYSATDLDGRTTLRRRIGYYGNAQRHDTLEIDVEAFRLATRPDHLLLNHRIRRPADGRLIAVSTVEKALEMGGGRGGIQRDMAESPRSHD